MVSAMGFWDDDDYLTIGRLVFHYGTAESFLWFLGHALGLDAELLGKKDSSAIVRAVRVALRERGLSTVGVDEAWELLTRAKRVRDEASHSAYLLYRYEDGLAKLQRRPLTLTFQPFSHAVMKDATKWASDAMTLISHTLDRVPSADGSESPEV